MYNFIFDLFFWTKNKEKAMDDSTSMKMMKPPKRGDEVLWSVIPPFISSEKKDFVIKYFFVS